MKLMTIPMTHPGLDSVGPRGPLFSFGRTDIGDPYPAGFWEQQTEGLICGDSDPSLGLSFNKNLLSQALFQTLGTQW